MTKEERNTQIMGKVANELTWINAKIEVLAYKEGYLDGRLNNHTFFTITLEDEYGARISIIDYGLVRVLMPIDKIFKLLRKLSK